jgi:hypothetical protein
VGPYVERKDEREGNLLHVHGATVVEVVAADVGGHHVEVQHFLDQPFVHDKHLLASAEGELHPPTRPAG